MKSNTKWLLDERDFPDKWMNLAQKIKDEYPKPLHPETKEEVTLDWLSTRYTTECAKIELLEGEYGKNFYIPIPEEVLIQYKKYRPTPLFRAIGLEKYLNYEGKIFFKREDLNPTGSHKPNTAIPQSYYGKLDGVEALVSDTGAGQWGAALALGCRLYDLSCIIFMTRNSYIDKPYRRYLMELAGAKVYPSPSNITERGRQLLKEDPEHHGSLGIGMGEAIDMVLSNQNYRLCLGCMSYYAAMHQTIVGQELLKQLEYADIEPDLLVACVGGGTNLFGFMVEFLNKAIEGENYPEMLAVESKNVPVLTTGTYKYDYADSFKLTHLLKMYTLGHNFLPPKIHAGGLRYHGKSTILSLMVHKGFIKATAIDQEECFKAGKIFYLSEGIIPAPESAHAIAAVIKEVEKDKKEGRKRNIVFCLSGTGYLDLLGYAKSFKLVK